MLNRIELIEKLNFHFPSYGAALGDGFSDESILFTGDNAASNLLSNDTGDGVCPVSVFLERHGWYVEHYDEGTALAFKEPIKEERSNTFYEWDRLIEKSKTEKLTEDEKDLFRKLQKKMIEMGERGLDKLRKLRGK